MSDAPAFYPSTYGTPTAIPGRTFRHPSYNLQAYLHRGTVVLASLDDDRWYRPDRKTVVLRAERAMQGEGLHVDNPNRHQGVDVPSVEPLPGDLVHVVVGRRDGTPAKRSSDWWYVLVAFKERRVPGRASPEKGWYFVRLAERPADVAAVVREAEALIPADAPEAERLESIVKTLLFRLQSDLDRSPDDDRAWILARLAERVPTLQRATPREGRPW